MANAPDFSSRAGVFQAVNTTLELNDLTLIDTEQRENLESGSASLAFRSDISVSNVSIIDSSGTGIAATDSSLMAYDSSITGSGFDGLSLFGTPFTIINSTINNSNLSGIQSDGDIGFIAYSDISHNGSIGVFKTSGNVEIAGSGISNNSGDGIVAIGGLIVSNSSVTHNALAGIGDIIFGSINNTTIAGNGFGESSGGHSGGIEISPAPDFSISISNSTITGNMGQQGLLGETFSGGISASGEASNLTLTNSIVAGNSIRDGGLDNLAGEITSGGSNITDEPDALDGPNDLNGIGVDQIFAETELVNGVLAGVAADNGGDTLTVALLDSFSNPALGRADTEVAGDFDQRGVPRDDQPDIGAFELELDRNIPDLVENQPVDPDLINGVPLDALVAFEDGSLLIRFESAVGEFANSLGYYIFDANSGEIGATGLLFSDTKAVHTGVEVLIDEVSEGESVGLFLIQRGAELNEFDDVVDFQFTERGNLDPASIFEEAPPTLFFLNGDGSAGVVEGSILHAFDFDGKNPINPRNGLSSLSSVDEEGVITIAFEDKNPGSSSNDSDFNDLVISVTGTELESRAAAELIFS